MLATSRDSSFVTLISSPTAQADSSTQRANCAGEQVTSSRLGATGARAAPAPEASAAHAITAPPVATNAPDHSPPVFDSGSRGSIRNGYASNATSEPRFDTA